MLSRREKLLVQPWEERRFKDHRLKVKSALPAIDDRPPAAMSHVAVKLKKCQRELDRQAKIQSDNFSLLQRLSAIMKVNRLDNRWEKPLPNFHKKVGQFFDSDTIRCLSIDRRAQVSLSECSHSSVKCYACEYRKMVSPTTSSEPILDHFSLSFLHGVIAAGIDKNKQIVGLSYDIDKSLPEINMR